MPTGIGSPRSAAGNFQPMREEAKPTSHGLRCVKYMRSKLRQDAQLRFSGR